MRPFDALSATVGEMLGGGRLLCVPSYQRAFAWSPREAGQLLDDVLLALDEATSGSTDTDCFLGAIVLMEPVADAPSAIARPGVGMPRAEIVDGLQRLVTLTILFAVLRDIAADDDPPSAALAASCVARPLPGLEVPAVQLVLSEDAQDFFHDFVQAPGATSAMPNDDDLVPHQTRLVAVREHLLATVLEESVEVRRRLVQFLRDRCHFAVITASTLDRAHRIFAVLNDRGRPLARGDILKAHILGAVPAARRESLHRLWSELEGLLGGSLEELFGHLRTIEGRSRVRILDEIRHLIDQSGDAEAFVRQTLAPYARILAAIRSGADAATPLPQAISSFVTYLGWLGSHDWMAPLMLYWRRVDGDLARLETFLSRLDRLAFGLRLLGVGSDKRVVRYRAIVEAIKTGTLDAPGSPLDLTRDEMRLILFNLRALHARSQLACKLVLLRLNDAIAGSPQRLDPADLTVEHVLPQKPGRNSQWRDWFPATDERERCTQSLGNLVLVSRDKNERARNLELVRKLEVYFEGTSPVPVLTRDLQGTSEWRPEDVRRREERLIGILDSLWAIAPKRPGLPPTNEDEGIGEQALDRPVRGGLPRLAARSR
ncbi:MAG: DUF262 domain-containing protein [Hyphomicrobiaceae bacterium]